MKTIGILSSSVPQCCMWGFGVSQRFSFGASGWLPEAPTLYFHFFYSFLPLGLCLGLVMGVVRGILFLLFNLLDDGSNLSGRVRLTRKTRSVALVWFIMIWIQGIQRRGDGKDCAPLPPKERRVRWACLAIFFLDSGLGEVCTGDAWDLPSEGTGIVGFRLVRPAKRTSALALVHLIRSSGCFGSPWRTRWRRSKAAGATTPLMGQT